MKKICFFLLTLVVCFTTNAQSNHQKDAEQIKLLRNDLNKAIANHHTDDIANFIWDDYSIVRGNSTQAFGKEAVLRDWKKLFTDNKEVNYIRIPTEIKISINDTLAWETGTWQGFHTYSKGGNYSAQWKKKNNIWKLQAELFVALY